MARILAVEDDPTHLALLTQLIIASGHLPVPAEDGEACLLLIEAGERPDLVLCDIRLPGVNGYTLARRLRADPGLRRVPLVAISSFGTPASREEAQQAGFDAWIEKPIRPNDIIAQLERLLGTRSAVAAVPAPPVGKEVVSRKPAKPASGKRILVLDDTDANREYMRVLLDFGGHAVRAVGTIPEALQSARAWQPDLIVCDMHLGRRSASEFLEAIKQDPVLRGTPFAVTSASPGPSAEQELLQAGAVCFLRLPMEPEVLLEEFERLLA